MNTKLVRHVLASPSEEARRVLLNDEFAVFLVDWREEDDAIVDYCEGIIQTGKLSAELTDGQPGEEFGVYIQYGDKRLMAPLNHNPGDRHVMICALNEILSPDYEIRLCLDSMGSDTLAFIPLRLSDWADLQREYHHALSKHFHKMTAEPNVFTDHIPVPNF